MDLQRFCDKSKEHYRVHRPFSRREWTFATNGHICIRVPRVPGFDDEDGPGQVEGMFAEAEFSRGAAVWQPLPAFELKMEECRWCGGKGYLKQCPAHNKPGAKCGNGEWKACKKYNDDCMAGCTPTDKGAVRCEECEGTGTVKIQSGVIVEAAFGKTKINVIYLDMIKDLPGIMIAPHDETSFFRLKFDGGDGLLMPMRMES